MACLGPSELSLVSWYKPFRIWDKWWTNMLISAMHFRFQVPYGNFELFKFLTDVTIVSIIHPRFFQSLLQLVHPMNFKRDTWKIRQEIEIKCFKHLVGKKRQKCYLDFSNTEKFLWLKNACGQGVHFIKSRILVWSWISKIRELWSLL